MTSVSVIMNGDEEKPHFTDAVGKTVPRPFVPPLVASPINLLNPDRYEFYTFNDKGELVRRLMTLREIQSIVANGNGAMISDNGEATESQSVMLNTIPLTNHDSDTKVQDIVDNVQNVLSREMENNKNFSSIPQDLLDTPNVSSSWSMILPAIFGNTGDEILPHRPINMTPETEVIDTTTTKREISTTKTTTKKPFTKVPANKFTTLSPLKTTTKLTQKVQQNSTTKKPTYQTTKKATQKPRPTPYRNTSRRPSPVVIVNELFPVDGVDETTKTILITSRPYSTSTSLSQSTTKYIPTTTRRTLVVKKPPSQSLPPVRKNVTNVINNNKLQASPSKDSHVTKIEMKPLAAESKTQAAENESGIEKVTQEVPITTVLSTTKIQLATTSQKPTSTVWSTLPSSSMTSSTEKIISTSKMPISTTTTSWQPVTLTTAEKLLATPTTTTTVKIPIKIVSTTLKPLEEVPPEDNFEEIRQDLAISQIIGSLQGDIGNYYKPFETNSPKPSTAVPETTTILNYSEEESEEETTTIVAMDKSGDDINLIPDKVFLDNLLYIDEKEPIVKDIPTTTEMPKSNEVEDDDSTTLASEPTYEKLVSAPVNKSKDEDSISLENSEVMQTIEKLLDEGINSKNKVHLEKLDVVSFDDDDETEIKLKDTLSSKEKLSHTEYVTKAATVASVINNKFITSQMSSTTTPPPNDDQDSTIPTILSEALSNVIEQMIKEQEGKKTTLPPPITTVPPPTTTTTAAPNDLIEPSLDELNKLLYHYQELQLSSQRDDLESLSLLNEKNAPLTTSTEPSTVEDIPKFTTENPQTEETSPIIMQKSKISEIQSVEFTTPDEPEDRTFSTTEEPQEFTTFFYVSDADVSTESLAELGDFTTEQYVVTEKRISNRKDEEITTSLPVQKKQSEEDEEESTSDLFTSVLNAIESINDSGSDEESTEKSNLSEESDEVESAISSISSTIDKTLKTDINADLGITKKLASSLVSVADTISETFNGGSDNESEESTDISQDTTVIPSHDVKSFTTVRDEEEKFLSITNGENLTTTESTQEETTEYISSSDESRDEITTEAISNETTSELNSSDMILEPKEKEDEMIQLSVRKEESLEKVDLVTHSSQDKSSSVEDDGNFIKIETISTTPSVEKLSRFKNKTTLFARPTYITQRSTTTTNIIPSDDQQPLQPKLDEEPITERVPLIEKASKESSTASIPITKTDHNLVQIKVQTKPTVTLPSSTTENQPSSTTVSNAQSIKNSIKNAQAQQMQHSRPAPIELSTAPQEALGLAASTANLNKDLSDFSKLCNDLAFSFWKSITADGISQSRSVIISPFALTSTLSMIFLGARGQTSGEMNDLLRLDDTVTFNPHVVFRNISESVEQSRNSGIATAAFVRELYSDRSKGKLLPYFKEKAQQFYGAHVEEVNFNVVNDILRRRTNLLVKKHTYNKIKEYLKTNNIWVNEPLAAVSANIFMVSVLLNYYLFC